MRGTLMRMLTKAQHIEILTAHASNVLAAAEYTKRIGKPVGRQNVKYWREIFITNEGNMAATDRALKEMRTFIKPEPDDDLGIISLPETAHRILVIPDQHIPYHHPDMLAFLCAVRDAVDPDLVVNLGDELDHHALSFHDSDPNLDSAGTELAKSIPVLAEFEREFPQQLICHSNHGSMTFRKAKAHGIPVAYLKRYREVLFPGGGGEGWSWQFAWRVKTPLGHVLFKHQSSGILGDAAHNQANLCVGHSHGNFSIEYAASSAHLYWGMFSGCLIDKDSLAFAYGKQTKNKPVIGCSVIIEGKPQLIPMILNTEGRWVGSL